MARKAEATKDSKQKEFRLSSKWHTEAHEPTFHSFPQDGECSCGVYKHHVHCAVCGAIYQVG